MRIRYQSIANISAVILSLFVTQVFAQETPSAQDADKKVEAAAASNIKSSDIKSSDIKSSDIKIDTPKNQPAKKMVQDATINLQTTITGNQEQPRVLYILPWQSPQTADVDFEPLDSQQKAVFGHVEREELRRELE